MLMKLKNIQKTYSTKNGVTFRALNNVSLSFDGKGLVYLVGASGSGKSTLLNVIGGLDSFDSGEYVLAGKRVSELKNSEVDSLRNKLMGFVFQEFNLIDTLTVFENVKLALDMQSEKHGDAVYDALKAMGIDDKARNKTKDLSGGQRQRVAIARALVKNPRIILADEPTGALDSTTTDEVVKILKDLSKDRLVIVVTHDMDMAVRTGDRIIEMKDGCVYRDVRKREDGEIIEVSAAEIFADTLMSVPAQTKLGESDVEKLNEIMEQSVRKTYINVESDPRKVKALFPNLREAVGSSGKKEKSEGSELESCEFVPYKNKDSEMESVEFKKSRLPLLKSMRLALNNLNFKKARLVLTVIVSFIAFVLFGVAQSFTSFDLNSAYVNTMREDAYGRVELVGSDKTINSYTRLAESDIKALAEKANDVKFSVQYELSFKPMSGENAVNTRNTLEKFDRVVEINDISECDFATVYGKSRPSGYDGIVISEYAAQSLIYVGAVKARDVGDLIGATVRMTDGSNFVIDGVFESAGYEMLMDSASPEDEMALKNKVSYGGWGQLYVLPGFVERYAAKGLESGTRLSYKMSADSIVKNTQDYNGESSASVKFIQKGVNGNEYEITPIVGTGVLERDGDVIVSSGVLTRVFGNSSSYEEGIRAFNADATRRMTLVVGDGKGDKSKTVFATSDIRIVGVIAKSNDGESFGDVDVIIMNDVKKETMVDNMYYPVCLAAGIRGANLNKFVEAVSENGFKLSVDFISSYNIVVAFIGVLHDVLLGLALVFCALVVLLLYGFISTSIRMTRKQIGILRAIGAKKSDTFKIYAVEGFIVTIFALVLSVAAIAIGAPVLNAMMGGLFGHYFSLFTIGWNVYLTMGILTLIVTIISVVIPLRKFNKITPVSAISGKE